jgi:hypothetical protein
MTVLGNRTDCAHLRLWARADDTTGVLELVVDSGLSFSSAQSVRLPHEVQCANLTIEGPPGGSEQPVTKPATDNIAFPAPVYEVLSLVF